MFVLSWLSGEAASAAYSSDNADLYDDYESFCKDPPNFLPSELVKDACNDIHKIRDSAAVSYINTINHYNQ